MTPESIIQKKIIKFLGEHMWMVVETSQGSHVGRGLIGFPDLISFRFGVTMLMEVKTPTGKLRPKQEVFKNRLQVHLGENLLYFVVHSFEDVEAIEELL